MSSGTHPSPHRLQPARGSGTAEPIPACRMGYYEVWLCLLCPFFPWADQSRLLLLQYPLPPPAAALICGSRPAQHTAYQQQTANSVFFHLSSSLPYEINGFHGFPLALPRSTVRRIQVFHRTFSIRAKRRRTAKVPNLLPSPSAHKYSIIAPRADSRCCGTN